MCNAKKFLVIIDAIFRLDDGCTWLAIVCQKLICECWITSLVLATSLLRLDLSLILYEATGRSTPLHSTCQSVVNGQSKIVVSIGNFLFFSFSSLSKQQVHLT